MNGPCTFRAVLSVIAALVLAAQAWAQTYPARYIRLVVPFPPGGPLDVGARLIAHKLTSTLGQSVVVENIPGASGTIGSRTVAQAAPDGHTLLFSGASALVISPLVSKTVDYDPRRDFAPVGQISSSRSVLVVSPTVPARTVQELVAYASDPGKLNYASAGIGTPPHLATEYLKLVAGIDMVHVPYKGGAAILTDLVSGRVDMVFQVLPLILPLVHDGKVRALAVASLARAPDLPDVPTMIESGFAGFVADNWSAVLAPAGTPKDIVERLNADTNGALMSADIRSAFARAGLDPVGGTPADLVKLLDEEWHRWDAVAQAAGLRAK